MKKAKLDKGSTVDENDILPHYDFRGGVRGKHAERFAAGTNVVRLDDDVAEVFHTPESVNAALRTIARLVRERTARDTV